jgi:cytoskeletal protein CcmA (bactofilin family)
VAKSRKASVVDGYAAIRAAQHAAGVTPTDVPDVRKPLEHAGKTTLPTKRLIICYACGYSYQLHGRVTQTVCSKCRTKLDCADHVIDSNRTDPLKAVGTIRIAANAHLVGCEIVGHDVILAGKADAARVTALHRLEIEAGATFSEATIQAPDLRIGPGATVRLERLTHFRDVTIAGSLEATLHATGTVRIEAGGLLRGTLRTEHLVMEDGGGLLADVDVRPLEETAPKRLAVA